MSDTAERPPSIPEADWLEIVKAAAEYDKAAEAEADKETAK